MTDLIEAYPLTKTVTDSELRLLVEAYSFQKDSALSIHQRNLLAALQELQAFRLMTGTTPNAVEPTPEPAVVVPELVWNSCGPGNGGLWDCPDSIDCAGYCSPPWTFDKATQEHQRRHREWVAEETKRRALNRSVTQETK